MQLTLRVVCSKGTYIRALARDMGQRLQSGAHLIALRRTRVGNYSIDNCTTIEDLQEQLSAIN
jgi:tRNA pseudouridine55 synthase